MTGPSLEFIMPATAKICRPEIGSHVHRYSLNGMYEIATIVSIVGPENNPDVWTGVIMTRNGHDFLGSDQELLGKFDWVPYDWTFDKKLNCWLSPEEVAEAEAEEEEEEPVVEVKPTRKRGKSTAAALPPAP